MAMIEIRRHPAYMAYEVQISLVVSIYYNLSYFRMSVENLCPGNRYVAITWKFGARLFLIDL